MNLTTALVCIILTTGCSCMVDRAGTLEPFQALPDAGLVDSPPEPPDGFVEDASAEPDTAPPDSARADAGRDAGQRSDAGPAPGARCDNPIDITGSGTFEGTSCDGDTDLVDCSGGPPMAGTGDGPRELWFAYSNRGAMWSAAFSVTAGFRMILSDPCDALACTSTHSSGSTGTLYIAVEREDGDCGDFVLTVEPR